MERQEEQPEGAVYSANMKQIETTNRLLAHIEDKLQNLITSKKTPIGGIPSRSTTNERQNESANTMNAKIIPKQSNNININNSSDTSMSGRPGNFRKDTNQMYQYPPTIGHGSYGKSNLEYQQQQLHGNNSNLSSGKGYQQKTNRSSSAINGGNSRTAAEESQQQQHASSSTSSSRNRLHELNELLLGRDDQQQFTAGTSKQQTQGGTLEYTKSPQKSQKSVIGGSEQEQLLQQHIPIKLFYDGYHEGHGDNNNNINGASENYRELSRVSKLLMEEKERNIISQENFQREMLRLKESYQKKSQSDDAVITKLQGKCAELEQEVTVLAREKSVLVESLQNEIQELKTINGSLSQENTSLRIAAIQGRTDQVDKNNNYSSSYRSLKNTITSQRDRDRENTIGIKDIDRVRDKENQLNNLYWNSNSNNNYNSLNTPNYGTIQQSSIRDSQQQQQYQQIYGSNSNIGYHQGKMGMDELQEITNENNTKMHTTFSQNDILMKQSGQNELGRIREELARQQAESTRMQERIQEFKTMNQQQQQPQQQQLLLNHLNAPSKENNNTTTNNVLSSDAQILLENYRLYAQQLEKSYEKLESVYQRESNDKQQIICQLQNSISQGYLQQNSINYSSQQTTQHGLTSKPKNNSRKNSSKRTVEQSGKNQRSKSLLNTSKRV